MRRRNDSRHPSNEPFKRHSRPGQTFQITSPPKPSPATKRRSGGQIPDELKDAKRGVRLQKYLAEAGVGSRRQCEELIAQGAVRVNRQPVTALPAWVNPFVDEIEVNGETLARPKGASRIRHIAREKAPDDEQALPYVPEGKPLFDKTYIVLHKPRQVVTTTSDPEGRPTVLDVVDVPHNVAARLFPVGRLDADSTGLILLTNDGQLAQKLTHPRFGIPKRYHVTIKGRLTQDDIQRLRTGVILAHRKTYVVRPDNRSADKSLTEDATVVVKRASMEEVTIIGFNKDRSRGDSTKVQITLREGQNREIRRLLARLDFQVKRLQRVGIGPLTLKGINAGQWRFLSPNEIAELKKSVASATRPERRKKPLRRPAKPGRVKPDAGPATDPAPDDAND